MPQISNLRFLLSSTNLNSPKSLPFFFPSPLYSFCLPFRPRILQSHKPRFLVTSLHSSSKKSSIDYNPLNLSRRKNSSLRESLDKDKSPAMEKTESVGFNRKRAEGTDGSDRPKKILQLKTRALNPVNTICYAQILGTGLDTHDTSPSVLLFFDKQRFIFNAGEGLQRFCTEHKIKLSKIDHIFLSRVCSETAGGLPGLLLTLAGIGEEGMSVNVWGPSDLKYLVDAMKSFIPNAAMVHTRSFGSSIGSDEFSMQNLTKLNDPLILVDDEVVKISAILLQPDHLDVPESERENSTSSNLKNGGENNVERRDQHSNSLLQQCQNTVVEIEPKAGDISVVYICELPEIKGKFDSKKASALGLKPGPKYRELQLGNSVKSDRQDVMVHPSDVLGPSVPGPIMILIDCPTSSHLQELLSVQSLSKYYADTSSNPGKVSKRVNCVIHLTPSTITNTNDYQNWMSRFGGAQHILAGRNLRNIEVPILMSSARIATQLHYLCPNFFPTSGVSASQQLKCLDSSPMATCEGSVSNLIYAENLLKFRLRPYAQLGLDTSCVPNLMVPSTVIADLLSETPEIADAAQKVEQLWHEPEGTMEVTMSKLAKDIMIEEPWLNYRSPPSCLDEITREDMEIVLLGTGSSQPSKYRNVSSIFVNLFSKGGIILDCGEGTVGQLKRRFGIEGADDVIRGLRCIWISHIHADHHTGLVRVLALRRDLLKGIPHKPLIVIGPRKLKRFLDAYQKLEGLDMQFLDCRHTTEASLDACESNQNHLSHESPKENNEGLMNQNTDYLFSKGSQMQSIWKRPGSPVDNKVAIPILSDLRNVLKEAGLEALISFPVVHCPQAYGVVLRAADRVTGAGNTLPGWKFVYSGDTRPCPELVKASHGATVLIHEATFEDGLSEEAVARNHSTTKEAIEVGDDAGAYRIILTHFSQRYPKIPVFDEAHMHKTCIAFDLMSVNLADLHVLPKVLPYLKLLFRNEMVVDESDDVTDVMTAAS